MKLYVLRHGQSPSATEAGVSSDAQRPLSDKGRQDVRRQAEGLVKTGAAPLVILTSPMRRAMETAREAASTLKPRLGVREFEPLSNQIPGEALWARLLEEASRLKGPEVMAVGHQPQLGEMVTHASGQTIEMRPGGLAAIESSGGKALLLWSQNP